MKVIKNRPTSGDDPGLQESYCWYLHWSYLSKACLNVRLRLIAAYTAAADAAKAEDPKAKPRYLQPRADRWGFFSTSRAALFGYVRQEWCMLTGEPFDHFPYSEDGVVKMWIRERKRSGKADSDAGDEIAEITKDTDVGLVEANWLRGKGVGEPETPFDLPPLPEA